MPLHYLTPGHIPSLELTWKLIQGPFKRIVILKGPLLHFHVNLDELEDRTFSFILSPLSTNCQSMTYEATGVQVELNQAMSTLDLQAAILAHGGLGILDALLLVLYGPHLIAPSHGHKAWRV